MIGSIQVNSGEFVYYPSGYWHQTENLDDENIAFSTTLIDQNNFQAVEKEMLQECTFKHQRFSFTPDVCDGLKAAVFPWWQNAFVGDFSTAPAKCALS